MLEAQDVGFRVVVRRVVGERDGRPLFSDILGDLLSFTDDELVVDGKNGPERIPRAKIVAGKRIPPKVSGGQPGGASHSPSAHNA